ncbi:3'-5' exonuclease [Ralstonia pseudosolanacearum]|uniref:3'-5' exonuclease n=1 Tax=Ralstonia pseudosolanacearum TaxID=1310165 RepID=UPI0002C101FF|nr:3'-5' exonuclease [Ralstonia pseudosolanacearum]ANH34833.1 Superfamily I DNA and RNA helicase [Ralstonia solanacearum]ESS51785.1 superfamily I DNA/RNA helicase [Ralstonia solanacearum SD54]AGH86292.1 Superfamily I DNA and RNA helicase [Ralstonia pseudosolanacearum FQY_4]MCK4149858.1 AAA family ATPase [Ralstonia pseudosolanacearum]BCL90072.1 DNA helicase [Ralstonia solanacearum]
MQDLGNRLQLAGAVARRIQTKTENAESGEVIHMALPKPVGKQLEVVCLAATGQYVVLGTAGSGKTTMAIARARYLANGLLPDAGRTLIVTYNRALMNYINSFGDEIPQDVDVRNYHRFARGYLNSRGELPDGCITSTGQREMLIEQAIEDVRQRHEDRAFFHRPLKFFLDEIQWLNGRNIESVDRYNDVTRTGRASAQMNRVLRPIMWEILERYRQLKLQHGKLYDMDDIAAAVSASLDRDTSPRMYKHIIIDEGQDLSLEMIRSLTKAVPPDGSITFFGDVAQRIYGHGRGMSWRDAGFQTRQVWRFEQNYRNTRNIAKLAIAVSEMPYFSAGQDMIAPIVSAADGPKPALVHFTDPEKERELVRSVVGSRYRTQSVAVLLRTHEKIREIRPYLPADAVQLKEEAANWMANHGAYFGTYHSAKGLEFDLVILPFLSDAEIPNLDDAEADEVDEIFAEDGRLLYVGITRAKTSLVLTYTGGVTELLPTDDALYSRSSR